MNQQQIDEVLAARNAALDEARPDAVAATHAAGRLTPRERVAALCDEGSFVEYGVQALSRANSDDGPADGLVGGVGRVAGRQVVVASYDREVYGGTQSALNTRKIERLIFLAQEHAWPFVCFVDGEGNRPGEYQGGFGPLLGGTRIGLWDGLSELSGLAPTVAVISGTAVDGNAAIAMMCDITIAVAGSTIGALDTEPVAVEVHEQMGDIDCIVPDEAAAIAAVQRYLAYMLADEAQGEPAATAADIARIVPDNRRRAYDMRKVIDALADADSVFELRSKWGHSMITSLARMGGQTVGIIANQPMSPFVGAIDAVAADKMSRFIELCDAYNVPVVSLIDSPGFHIGPDAERAGIARHHVRTLSALEHRDVPLYCVQLRKAYGLGPLVMRGSWGHLPPELRLAWPTVETGGMSLEGAAYLAKRKEILAAPTKEEALRIRDEYANTLRARASGIKAAQDFTFDEVVDPGETRDRIVALLRLNPRKPKTGKKTYLDTV